MDYGPPSSVVEAGIFQHACEGEAVIKLTNEKIPYFNAPMYLQNITQVVEDASTLNGGSQRKALSATALPLCACASYGMRVTTDIRSMTRMRQFTKRTVRQ